MFKTYPILFTLFFSLFLNNKFFIKYFKNLTKYEDYSIKNITHEEGNIEKPRNNKMK